MNYTQKTPIPQDTDGRIILVFFKSNRLTAMEHIGDNTRTYSEYVIKDGKFISPDDMKEVPAWVIDAMQPYAWCHYRDILPPIVEPDEDDDDEERGNNPPAEPEDEEFDILEPALG